MGAFPIIAVMNKATVPLGVDLAKLIAALQKCYDQHFLPVWGYPVRLEATDTPASYMWQFLFLDDADAANALGYHDLTKDNQPISKVFVRPTIADGELVSVTACHELFEMAIDPYVNLWAEGPGGKFYAMEMSDAVEETTFSVDGIPMSNFVHPAFFEPGAHPKGTKFDHLGLVKRPFQTLKGGYQIVRDAKGTHEVFGSKEKEERFRREDRRGHRSEHRKVVHRPNFAQPGDYDE
jgi:hypothetical protein